MTHDKSRNDEFPAGRIRRVLDNAPARFTLIQFAQLYRVFYGHGDRDKSRDLAKDCYSWKKLAAILTAAGAQQIGEYAVRETRFANPHAPAPKKETAEAAKPSPAPAAPTPAAPTPAAPTSTIERLEARLSELQRVVDLQTKIKEVEAQIALS